MGLLLSTEVVLTTNGFLATAPLSDFIGSRLPVVLEPLTEALEISIRILKEVGASFFVVLGFGEGSLSFLADGLGEDFLKGRLVMLFLKSIVVVVLAYLSFLYGILTR